MQPPHEPRHEERAAAVTDLPGRPCSIAAALKLVGERWALLVLRELSLGHHRFDALVRNTGAPRDVLTARLRHLEATGIIERRQYQERPPRFEYHLTDAGREISPVLHTLRAWGDRWAAPAGPPAAFVHECGHPLDPVVTCRACGEEVAEGTVSRR